VNRKIIACCAEINAEDFSETNALAGLFEGAVPSVVVNDCGSDGSVTSQLPDCVDVFPVAQ